MPQNPRVYSYLRFSDPRQAAGSSADRQLEYARRWASDRGMTLDAALSMQDEGLSAYHQRHVTRGALGVFLQAVDEGRITRGSVLIVEGLDRLSRAEPIQAQAQLAQIINAGITVVTASDGREYNRNGLKAQPMDLVYSLLVMIRAHEESDTKSKRVRAAIHRQCQGWIAGTWRGVVRNGRDPHWQRLDAGEFRIVEERAAAVHRAIELFVRGYGGKQIMSALESEGLQLTNGGNPAGQLYRIIRNRALTGEKLIEVDGQEYRLEGYYPPLLTPAEFAELQHLAAARARIKGGSEIPAIITGMRLTTCGYCGSAVASQNLMGRKRREDGKPQDGHRRLICVGNSQGSGCAVAGSCSVVPIERALMAFCADKMNLRRLLKGSSRSEALASELAVARAHAADVAAKIERITDAMLSDAGATAPASFLRRAREMEAELEQERGRIARIENDLSAATSAPTPAAAAVWAELAVGVADLDVDVRMRARQLIADTFERIVIYHRGRVPGPAQKRTGTIDIVLIAKRGATRLLQIDRQSGEWKAGEDVDATELPLPPAAR